MTTSNASEIISTAITISYFAAYFFLFFGVSIYCVWEIRQRRKGLIAGQPVRRSRSSKQRAKSKSFDSTTVDIATGSELKEPDPSFVKEWGQSVWRKKKIYGELVPHFFDQATDFGVVFEYYNYWQAGLSYEEIGINTKALFYVSIGIIVLHRVVSSVAIYLLTKSKLDAFYQLFDVLMIRCVYTNYQLQIDEPSNAQRYLQTMEAILEASPQILISTAFLIRAKTETVSETVVLSLFTSLLALCLRVAADDKQMFKDEWKEPLLKDVKGKLMAPYINIRYIIRVIFWRFLEISSRITLLVMVWINLGGRFVFTVILFETVFLIMLSWSMGSIDVMGNFIYLMAASSTKKSSTLAVPMMFCFWGYRIVSSWILLITITIYSATETESGSNFLDNESAAIRYRQTYLHVVGLVVFTFTWIATPLWQWVGAVVMFDYGNLAPVGRDVDALIDDNHWGQVLELISFGADFDAANLLLKVDLKRSSGVDDGWDAVLEKIATRCDDQLKEEELREEQKDQQNVNATKVNQWFREMMKSLKSNDDGDESDDLEDDKITCDKNHVLFRSKNLLDFQCTECAESQSNARQWHCAEDCDYALCDECFDKVALNGTCLNKHLLRLSDDEKQFKCIQCQKMRQTRQWKCNKGCKCDVTRMRDGNLRRRFAMRDVFGGNIVTVPVEKSTEAKGDAKQGDEEKKREEEKSEEKKSEEKKSEEQEIDYAVCTKCKRKPVDWKKFKDGLDARPATYCGVITVSVLIVLAFFFGSDISGLIIVGQYDCDMVSGSHYAYTLSVTTFLQVGAWLHISVMLLTGCCLALIVVVFENEDMLQMLISCFGFVWSFLFSWVIIGFLMRSEMNADNVIDNDQCIPAFNGWCITKSIELIVCVVAIAYLKGTRFFASIVSCAVLTFLFGSDISALIIVGQHDCDMVGGSEFVSFNVTTFLQVGAWLHISVLLLVPCCICVGRALLSETLIFYSSWCLLCSFVTIFFVFWIWIGFTMHSEMNENNVLDIAQCNPCLLSWNIIKLIELSLILLFVICYPLWSCTMMCVGLSVFPLSPNMSLKYSGGLSFVLSSPSPHITS